MSVMDASQAAALARVIAVANDKGGVGKTTISANLGSTLAREGYKVCLVDLNRQANLADDLGYRDTEIDDQGAALLLSIMTGRTLQAVPVPGRADLFVVPGGTALTDLTGVMVGRVQQHGRSAMLTLAAVLAEAAAPYDLVIIDTPPENTLLIDLALGAARWLLMPTKTDGGGLVGMRLLAERYAIAREINPSLGLLGVVLFGTSRSATAIHRDVRAKVEAAFGAGASPVLTAIIGHSERVAKDARELGMTAYELAAAAASQPAWWHALRTGEGGTSEPRISATASTVAGDFDKLGREVLQLLAAAESREAQA
ncbi:ParA family protein [Streptosporangium algeriense]|uniref:ParA family protein n=1 Tax=Streptosporangium algeriense TaxID=1682748 RepID=A0ABW3DKR7_9ACTN